MFSSGPNYNKLKTNLRLSVNRLKLLEKKKTETNQKARKEIAGETENSRNSAV
jgi:vacuolar protein sorting-associated protein IST1